MDGDRDNKEDIINLKIKENQMLKGFTRNFKPLEILNEEQIEAIQGH